MSLDVYLNVEEEQIVKAGTGIMVRRNGAIEELGTTEAGELFGSVVEENQETSSTEVYWANITHNLGAMARAADIYDALWRPDENGIETAAQLIPILERGLADLLADPERFKGYNPKNGWGDYEGLCAFTSEYLAACKEYPMAKVSVSR